MMFGVPELIKLYSLRRIHPLSVYPQVYIMWVLRNLGNVEKRFLPPTCHSFVHDNASFNCNIFLSSCSLDWVCESLHLPKCQLIFEISDAPCTNLWVVYFYWFLYLYVNYLTRQVIKNGMLTKEATSSTVVATSSALLKNSFLSCTLCLHTWLFVDTFLHHFS